MKKIQQILEEWELQCAAGISLKMGVSGFDATLLPTSDEKGLLSLSRLSRLSETRLQKDGLMLLGKLAYRQLSDGSDLSEEERAESGEIFAQPAIEQKRAEVFPLPLPGEYRKCMLQVKAEAHIPEPVVVLLNSSLKGELHLTLSIKRGARARIVVFSQLDVPSAQCLRLIQEEDSRLELIWLPLQTTPESFLALHASLANGASLTLHQPCLDQQLCFSNVIELGGRRARVETYAPSFGEGPGRRKIETSVLHHGSAGYSRINNRGVLADRAEGHYYGRQLIDKLAADTDSYQESRFLVLDDSARAHINPVMVIDENELQAGHAASVGSLDEEQLYYLRSRGLNRSQAQRLMTQAFLRPSLEAMTVPAVSEYLLNTLLKKVERA